MLTWDLLFSSFNANEFSHFGVKSYVLYIVRFIYFFSLFRFILGMRSTRLTFNSACSEIPPSPTRTEMRNYARAEFDRNRGIQDAVSNSSWLSFSIIITYGEIFGFWDLILPRRIFGIFCLLGKLSLTRCGGILMSLLLWIGDLLHGVFLALFLVFESLFQLHYSIRPAFLDVCYHYHFYMSCLPRSGQYEKTNGQLYLYICTLEYIASGVIHVLSYLPKVSVIRAPRSQIHINPSYYSEPMLWPHQEYPLPFSHHFPPAPPD